MGPPMVILQRKMKRLKLCLKDFNKKFYAEISFRVKTKREDLEELQKEILNGGTGDGLIERERDLRRELQELMLAEESLFKQKSKIQWL